MKFRDPEGLDIFMGNNAALLASDGDLKSSVETGSDGVIRHSVKWTASMIAETPSLSPMSLGRKSVNGLKWIKDGAADQVTGAAIGPIMGIISATVSANMGISVGLVSALGTFSAHWLLKYYKEDKETRSALRKDLASTLSKMPRATAEIIVSNIDKFDMGVRMGWDDMSNHFSRPTQKFVVSIARFLGGIKDFIVNHALGADKNTARLTAQLKLDEQIDKVMDGVKWSASIDQSSGTFSVKSPAAMVTPKTGLERMGSTHCERDSTNSHEKQSQVGKAKFDKKSTRGFMAC